MTLPPVRDPNSTKYPDRMFFHGFWMTPKQMAKERIRHRAQQAAWSEEKRERQRQASRKHARLVGRYAKYGITKADYERMIVEQENKCKTCFRLAENSRGGVLVIDHNHDTGVVRGLLCHNCNVALGLVNERVEVLNALIALVLYGDESDA